MGSTPYIQAQRVDPLKKADGTGVLGRISDDLTKQGLHVGAYGIDVNAISLLGQPGISSAPFILSRGGVTQFNYDKSSDTMENLITSLNEDTANDSGVFSELWSSRLLKSVADNQVYMPSCVTLCTMWNQLLNCSYSFRLFITLWVTRRLKSPSQVQVLVDSWRWWLK